MNALATGVYGRCGTALVDHLYDRDEYDWTLFNRSDRPDDHPYGGYDTVIGDVTDGAALRAAATGQDAMVHMAAYPYTGGDWDDVHDPNVGGLYNALEAARREKVESVVFLSTNHVMGLYEDEHAPELYEPGYGLVLDATDPVRPDSLYGVTKAFGEALGRYYVETHEYPKRFYALRVCSVRMPEYDHPYGDAEASVDEGEFERDSDTYERQVARMKATWHSRRDFAHQVDRCLRDESVTFDVFHGVSDNTTRWFSIENARARLGYDPQDDGTEWDEPPA
ncbi:MAG: NAD(P)-dependent oxidoreductase [Haloarculaceae archaeon]